MRVWERGTGETLACGTGTCATVVAAILNGLVDTGEKITVHLLGGDLEIVWSGDENDSVFMTGPAETVFTGEVGIQIVRSIRTNTNSDVMLNLFQHLCNEIPKQVRDDGNLEEL